jgi:hypothetical protein
MARNRGLPALGTGKNRGRLDDFRIEVTALSKKSREIFLVGDNFSEA